MRWRGKSAQGKPKSAPSGSPSPRPPEPRAPETELLDPLASEFRGEVFLALHGLNLHPERMAAWCGLLRGEGFAVARVALTGHDPSDRRAWGGVTADQWLDDVTRAHAEARRRWPGARISLLGYSLGAPLGLLWGIDHGVSWRRIVLLAPALRVRGLLAPLLRLSDLVPRTRLRLPSLAPRSYRAHASTTISAFRALQELIDRLRRREADLPRCPQLVIYADQDELISVRHLPAYRDLLPASVTLYRLALSRSRRYPSHLAIDPRTVGEVEWARLAADTSAWLNGGAAAVGAAALGTATAIAADGRARVS